MFEKYYTKEQLETLKKRAEELGEDKIRAALDRCLTVLGNQSLRGKLVVVDKDKIRVRG